MKSFQRTLAIGVFALGATAFAASDPAYNASSVVDVDGVIAAVRTASDGTHLTVKTKNAMLDVYLAPTEFLRIFKTSFPVGNEIEVVGSKVKVENNDVVLAREVSVGSATITLRDAHGAPDWKNWGVEIDPSAVR